MGFKELTTRRRDLLNILSFVWDPNPPNPLKKGAKSVVLETGAANTRIDVVNKLVAVSVYISNRGAIGFVAGDQFVFIRGGIGEVS